MCGQTVVGFRDSASLYFPMFEAIDAAWAEGKVPLWNPFCNFGMPLVADGTSSVFYPGKAIFVARFLSYPSRYGIYLGLHVLLAAVSTYWLARKMRCQRPGATIAAIAFAFGAPVVFQATNVIYLVSASWLPIAILGVWCFLNTHRIAWALLAAIACAMMILGGDPQMVYHVGLIAAVSVACCGFSAAIGLIKRSPNSKQRLQSCGRQIVCLLSLVVATTLMAVIQLWPTAQLAARSERAEQAHAVNLYSTFQQDETGKKKSFNALLTTTDVIVGQYQFSLPPWSLIEMIAPNVSGKPFPTNARWFDCLPAGDRMWYPSLYIGLTTLLLAIGQIRFWGRNKTNVWLSWILLVFLLGSFGWVWVDVVVSRTGRSSEARGSVGGTRGRRLLVDERFVAEVFCLSLSRQTVCCRQFGVLFAVWPGGWTRALVAPVGGEISDDRRYCHCGDRVVLYLGNHRDQAIAR